MTLRHGSSDAGGVVPNAPLHVFWVSTMTPPSRRWRTVNVASVVPRGATARFVVINTSNGFAAEKIPPPNARTI